MNKEEIYYYVEQVIKKNIRFHQNIEITSFQEINEGFSNDIAYLDRH